MLRRRTIWAATITATLLSACGGSMSDESAKYASESYGGMQSAGSPGMPPPAPEAPRDESGGESDRLTSAEAAVQLADYGGDSDMKLDHNGSSSPPPPPMDGSLAAKPAPTPAQVPKPGPNAGSTDGASGEVSRVQGPMLIYTANLTMAVFEVAVSVAKVEQVARDIGGFLAKRDDTSITIRVPVERFREAVERIEKSGDVLHRNVSVQDVTEEYRDLDIQMRNARAMRDRLAELLQKASKVEESLLIERELGRVAKEVDRLEGRLKFLRDRASFSTITVSFQAVRTEEQSQSPFHLPVPWLSEMGLGRLFRL